MYYVYRFIDKNENVIYVGKAKNISSRISGHNHLSKECYDSINKIEYIELNNQSEGSMYEIYWINKLTPKYNVEYNKGDSISFDLPKKEWKIFKNLIKTKKQNNKKEIRDKIKMNKANGNLVIQSNNMVFIVEKQKVDSIKHTISNMYENSYLITKNSSEILKYIFKNCVCNYLEYYDESYTKFKKLKIFGNSIFCGKTPLIDIKTTPLVYIKKETNEIFISIGQSSYISMKFKDSFDILYFESIIKNNLKMPNNFIIDDFEVINFNEYIQIKIINENLETYHIEIGADD